jgi:hypothetical protein
VGVLSDIQIPDRGLADTRYAKKDSPANAFVDSVTDLPVVTLQHADDAGAGVHTSTLKLAAVADQVQVGSANNVPVTIMQGGAQVAQFGTAKGLILGSPSSGGDMGPGFVNAQGLAINGNPVSEVFIQEVTAANQASVVVTFPTSGFKRFRVAFDGLYPGATGVNAILQLSLDGTSYYNNNYFSGCQGFRSSGSPANDSSASYVMLFPDAWGVDSSSTHGIWGEATFWLGNRPAVQGQVTMANGIIGYMSTFGSILGASGNVKGFKFSFSAGNVFGGKLSVYGVR